MLYRIRDHEAHGTTLDPQPFSDMAELGKLEKDLERLVATHFFDVLPESAPLMPVFQERPRQAEADLYALDPACALVIFELKRTVPTTSRRSGQCSRTSELPHMVTRRGGSTASTHGTSFSIRTVGKDSLRPRKSLAQRAMTIRTSDTGASAS